MGTDTASFAASRLADLGGDLAPLQASATRYLQYGTQLENGALLIAPMPWIGSRANAFWLYEPLPDAWRLTAFNIPDFYASILSRMNGCFAFKLALYGVPSQSGLLNRSSLRPLALESAARHWGREFDPPPGAFHFGGSPFNSSENVGYFYADDRFLSLRRGGQVAREWSSFADFLSDELARLEQRALEPSVARVTWRGLRA